MTEYKSKISEYIAGKIPPEEFLSYLENTPELFDKLEKLTLEAGIMQKVRKQVPLDFFFTELSDEAKNSINGARNALMSASKETQTAYAKDLLLLLRKLNSEKEFLPATLSMQLDLYHSNIDAPNYAEMLPDFMRGIFDTTHFIEEECPYNVRGITENRSRTLAWHYVEIQTRFAFLMSALFPDESFARDEKLREKASFSDDVRPDYIGGGDLDTERIIGGIIDKIIAEFPDNMPLTKRKKAIKEKIKEAFPCKKKKAPRWIQSEEWQISANGKPMRFIEQKSAKDKTRSGTDVTVYYFEDTETGEIRTVEQFK